MSLDPSQKVKTGAYLTMPTHINMNAVKLKIWATRAWHGLVEECTRYVR